MFDQTFLAPERSQVSSLRFLASVLMECAAVALLILFSLAVSPRLPVRQLRSLLIVPRAPLSAEKVPVHPHESIAGHPGFRHLDFAIHIAPLPAHPTTSQAAAAPDLAPAMTGTSGNSAGPSSDVLFSSGDALPAEPPRTVHPTQPQAPVAIGGSVAEANLLNKIVPVYPPLAKATRVQGTVVFRAIIGKDGRIDNLQVVSGHPLLIRAAQQAVMQWRYRPTLLNGVPVEVATEITVRFSLGTN